MRRQRKLHNKCVTRTPHPPPDSDVCTVLWLSRTQGSPFVQNWALPTPFPGRLFEAQHCLGHDLMQPAEGLMSGFRSAKEA